MKSSTKDFLMMLERKTSIKIDWSSLKPTEKYVQTNNQPVELDTLNLNGGSFIMLVYSCGCKTCKEVMGIQIFYGLGGSKSDDAETIKKEIIKVAPGTNIVIYNLFDLKSIA
jgi:hypothetical protein